MTEQQFLNELEMALTKLPSEERNDIFQDIKEYFKDGREDGKSDSEIAASLGSPKQIGEELLASYVPEKTEPTAATKKIKITDTTFTKVDMNIHFGALKVYPSESEDTIVELVNGNDKLELTAEVKGDTLKIKLREAKFRFLSFLFIGKGVQVNVALPAKMYSSILMKTDNGTLVAEKLLGKTMAATSDNGSIKLTALAATSLDVETDNGRITIEKVQTNTFSAKTDNGRIDLRHIDADQIHTETDNGRIEMEYVNGNITGKTDNGRISLLTTTLDRMIDLETDNGSISVVTENNPTDVTIRANVEHGKVDVFGEKNSRTTFGNGTNTVQLSTDNGKITVYKKEVSVPV
ncbi:DUF4097 family beta strand repeat-containing protein [Paenisporosarcina sp.]|uniref:DUF4097 family beta strand repeat-containing protein n=1 Tax=Paenisporosarcina sp. TaxID=1932001 RepID=UPI003C770096